MKWSTLNRSFLLFLWGVIFLALSACSSKTNIAPPSVSTGLYHAPKDKWEQKNWAKGPGQSAVGPENGYWFAGGVRVLKDGSISLSKVDAAKDTIDSDLNQDGYPDLIVANSGNYEFVDTPFAQIRHQNEDHEMPDAQIYWGGPDGYSTNRASGIPGDRPSSLAAIDFNLDGYLDLAVAGGGEFHPPYVNSRVYWGGPNGFDRNNYVSLPTYAATGTAAGDLNQDGYPDVIFANLGDYNFPFPPSLVYWGSPDGFTPDNRTELETHGVGGLALADLNGDKSLDLVFANSAGFPPVEQLMDYGQDYPWPPSYIYLWQPFEKKPEKRLELPTKGATGVKVSDLNKDGYLDLVFANAGSFALPPLPDSYIYWGGPDGFKPANRTNLATNGASAVSVADINRDNWPDLVLSVTGTYLYIGKPAFPPSFVYWGGPKGFSDTNRLALQTEGSQGNIITDFNGDGSLDICFSQLGDFNKPYRPVKVFLSTGDATTFYTESNTTTLPGQISYGAVVVGAKNKGDSMSHGNLAVPSYANSSGYLRKGSLVSSTWYSDASPAWQAVRYEADIPSGTSLELTIETSPDMGKSWQELNRLSLSPGPNQANLDIAKDARQTIRYRLTLTSNDGQKSPTLRYLNFG